MFLISSSGFNVEQFRINPLYNRDDYASSEVVLRAVLWFVYVCFLMCQSDNRMRHIFH